MNKVLGQSTRDLFIIGFLGLVIVSTLLGVALEQPLILLAPLGFLIIFLTLVDFKKIFFLFFAVVPFSVEFYLPGGIGTDLPTEPIMLLLLGISILLFIGSFYKISADVVRHPLVILILLHLFWIFFTCITSTNPVISYKYFLAKCWYVLPFFFLPLVIVQQKKDLKLWVVLLVVTITIATAYVFIRHAFTGFDFRLVNQVTSPIFRNHVTYAALPVLFLPFLWWFWRISRKYSFRYFILLGVILFWVAAIYLSYTRAAQLCIVIAILGYFIVARRLIKPAIFTGLVVLSIGILFVSSSNRYLEFAPDFEKTITHDNFGNLVSATSKGQDLSTMERLYRWVAGSRMVQDRPLVGFGPGSFFFNYKNYTLSEFKTYVSDNPDNSGIHNYYLMVLVEQGIPGVLIFLTICILTLILGENLFHSLQDRELRLFVMAILLSSLIIFALNAINDLIETDKLGPFFFFNLSMIAAIFFMKKRGQVQ